jgi:hypothetical protein
VNQAAKKWLLVGAGFGVGCALTLGLIIGCVALYSSRPKPWDQKSLVADSSVLWVYTLDSNSPSRKIANVAFIYAIRNTTNQDIRVSNPVTIMLNPEGGDLTELTGGLYSVRFPSFIPVGKTVQVELDAPPWFTAGKGKGFILYDPLNHLQINLPEPSGPTESDQGKNGAPVGADLPSQ